MCPICTGHELPFVANELQGDASGQTLTFVDFDFSTFSAVCPILLGQLQIWQNWQNSKNQSQQKIGSDLICHLALTVISVGDSSKFGVYSLCMKILQLALAQLTSHGQSKVVRDQKCHHVQYIMD